MSEAVEKAMARAREVMRSQFTMDDLKRNLDHMCKDFTPEQLYDLYEFIFIHLEEIECQP